MWSSCVLVIMNHHVPMHLTKDQVLTKSFFGHHKTCSLLTWQQIMTKTFTFFVGQCLCIETWSTHLTREHFLTKSVQSSCTIFLTFPVHLTRNQVPTKSHEPCNCALNRDPIKTKSALWSSWTMILCTCPETRLWIRTFWQCEEA